MEVSNNKYFQCFLENFYHITGTFHRKFSQILHPEFFNGKIFCTTTLSSLVPYPLLGVLSWGTAVGFRISLRTWTAHQNPFPALHISLVHWHSGAWADTRKLAEDKWLSQLCTHVTESMIHCYNIYQDSCAVAVEHSRLCRSEHAMYAWAGVQVRVNFARKIFSWMVLDSCNFRNFSPAKICCYTVFVIQEAIRWKAPR